MTHSKPIRLIHLTNCSAIGLEVVTRPTRSQSPSFPGIFLRGRVSLTSGGPGLKRQGTPGPQPCSAPCEETMCVRGEGNVQRQEAERGREKGDLLGAPVPAILPACDHVTCKFPFPAWLVLVGSLQSARKRLHPETGEMFLFRRWTRDPASLQMAADGWFNRTKSLSQAPQTSARRQAVSQGDGLASSKRSTIAE